MENKESEILLFRRDNGPLIAELSPAEGLLAKLHTHRKNARHFSWSRLAECFAGAYDVVQGWLAGAYDVMQGYLAGAYDIAQG